MGHVTLITRIRGYFVIPGLTLDIFFVHRDTIAGIETENGSCDPDHTF